MLKVMSLSFAQNEVGDSQQSDNLCQEHQQLSLDSMFFYIAEVFLMSHYGRDLC
jgi:hypothetical protein